MPKQRYLKALFSTEILGQIIKKVNNSVAPTPYLFAIFDTNRFLRRHEHAHKSN
jgi:hypothetical protein